MLSQEIEKALGKEAVQWRHDLHRHPELAFQEHRTAAYLAELLESFGYTPARGIGGTGLVATLDRGDGPTIGFRSDMDALPIQEQTGLAYASEVPGKMHACGHDGHMAMLLAAAQYLVGTDGPPGKIRFIFQPAEEGEAGAKAMIEDGLFRDFPVDEIYGLHNWPGLDNGIFAARPGSQMAGFDVFTITLSSIGTHAAMPHLGTDSLSAAASLQAQLQTIVSRSIDPLASAVVSVSSMQGGDAWNVLPDEVVLKGCTRYLTTSVQDQIEQRMEEICSGIARSFNINVSLDYDRRYPATINAPQQTRTALAAAKIASGRPGLSDMLPSMASEDFSFMLNEKPGCFTWLGNGPIEGGCLLHNSHYNFNDDVLFVGAAYWVALAKASLD